MKKGKFLKTLAIAGTCLCAPLLLSGCTSGNENKTDFRVYDGYIQVTKDGTTWEDLVDLDTLKGLPGDDADVWTIGLNGNWFRNGIDTGNKAIGTNGVGITSITKNTNLSTSTLTVYDILFDNGTSSQIQIPNGEDGEPGDDADVWTIGDDGYWYKNGDKTEDKAIGEDGDEYTIGPDGYWYLNGEKTEYKAVGQDASYATYTITYDYGISKEYFDNATSVKEIKSTEWITELPALKEEYAGSLKGWYISGTDKEIKLFDFIGGNITLEPRFEIVNNAPAGLYQNNKHIKSWETIVKEYPTAFSVEGEICEGESDNYGFHSSAFKELAGDLVVSNNINTIGEYAFYNCKNLTNIQMPEGLINIKHRSFYSCMALTKLEIPASVTNIELEAFSHCGNLKSIVVADGNAIYDSRNNCNAIIETSSNVLLRGCDSTVIPTGITKIENYAFNELSKLNSVEIPETVINIGSGAFSNCINLTKIKLPASVSILGSGVFSNCERLYEIVVAEGNAVYNSKNNCNAIIETSSGKLIQGCLATKISADIKTIGSGAFLGAGLRSITIPETVTSIEPQAFQNCKNLKSVEIISQITTIPSYLFFGCSNLTSVKMPESITNIQNEAFSNCDSLTSIQLPSGLKQLGEAAFSYCDNLNSIELPDGLSSISNYLFQSCKNLKNITIPENVTSIGKQAFAWSGITEIAISSKIDSIGSNAFVACTDLLTVVIDSNCIEEGYFLTDTGCDDAKTLYIKSGITIDSGHMRAYGYSLQTSDKDGYDMYVKNV